MSGGNNWLAQLPGISAGILPVPSNNSNWSIQTSMNQSNAITICNSEGGAVLTFHKDGMIETASGKIKADEWIQITMIMKQFIMDVAKDDEVSKKYPYIKDMAHNLMIGEIKGK